MSITMYGIKNCDTIRQARAWLDARGVAYAFHDYKTAGIDRARLEAWCDEHGWERVCNRAGTTFRKLPDADKQDLDGQKAIGLMLSQPSLIKRPVLVIGGGAADRRADRVLIGFTPGAYADAIRGMAG